MYTDVDVIFFKDIPWESMQPPQVISLGGEHERGKIANSGVMIMNIAEVGRRLPSLLDLGDSRNWSFTACDQGLILEFFSNVSVLLPDSMNWKPYWGTSDEIVVLHHHGPKPGDVYMLLLKMPYVFNISYMIFI